MDARGKLVELLQVDLSGSDGYEPELIADYLIANGVTVQEWIPVTERLPESEGTYLVYTKRGSVYASHFYEKKVFRDDYVREQQWSQRGKVKVTHWMPLPEPPKEETP